MNDQKQLTKDWVAKMLGVQNTTNQTPTPTPNTSATMPSELVSDLNAQIRQKSQALADALQHQSTQNPPASPKPEQTVAPILPLTTLVNESLVQKILTKQDDNAPNPQTDIQTTTQKNNTNHSDHSSEKAVYIELDNQDLNDNSSTHSSGDTPLDHKDFTNQSANDKLSNQSSDTPSSENPIHHSNDKSFATLSLDNGTDTFADTLNFKNNSENNTNHLKQQPPIMSLSATPFKMAVTDTVEIAPTAIDKTTTNTHYDNDEYHFAPKGLIGAIGKLGAYVGTLGKSTSDYTAVDLTAKSFETDPFQAQSQQLFRQLFGQKAVQAQSLAGKLISDDKKQGASDWLYGKIASLAERWAFAELKRDKRFGQLADLTDHQKTQFLQDLHNQTRGFAVLGGASALFGLKGVVLDTAWLLLVSLKSVYQTAHIAGTPLTGDDSIRLAYGILAGANLDKMQEKQVLLTGLALGKTALKNAQTTGLSGELATLGNKYQLGHTEQLDKLAQHLDKFNGKLAQRLLPIGSALVAGYYNRQLIDEVLGTAKASLWQEFHHSLENQADSTKNLDNSPQTTDNTQNTNPQNVDIKNDTLTDEPSKPKSDNITASNDTPDNKTLDNKTPDNEKSDNTSSDDKANKPERPFWHTPVLDDK